LTPISLNPRIPKSTTDGTLSSESNKKIISTVLPTTCPSEELHEVTVFPYDFDDNPAIDTVNDKSLI